MELILIRHPKTVAPLGTCYGSTDLEADANHLATDAARLRPLMPRGARFVASPLQRAHRLACALGEPVETDDRLVEVGFGEWEMKRWDDLPRSDMDAWAANVAGHVPPGGESLNDVQARVLDWWDSVEKTGTLVAVAHGGPWRILGAHLLGMPLERSLSIEIQWGGRAHFRVSPDFVQLRGWNLF